MMRVADYIMERLAEFGVEDIFMITGGGAMHLNDAAGRRLRYFCNHHEQASAIAAEGYARASGRPAVVVVTTGPGGLNTLTGVMGQWTDSVPVVYISGQVKYETTIRSCRELPLRQLGDQEVDIVEVVRPLTKYAVCLTEPGDVARVVEEAWHHATMGRPGPVWIDVPMNVQAAMVKESELLHFQPEAAPLFDGDEAALKARQTAAMLKGAERPLLVAGHGITIGCARELFLKVVEDLSIPVVTTFNGFDIMPSTHPLFIGRIGTIGDRAGNFALQNADLVITLGSRNNIRQASYNWNWFARGGKKVVVDIDAAELAKPTVVPDLAVHADVGFFLTRLAESLPISSSRWPQWLSWCAERRERYPVYLPEYAERLSPVNPYHFVKVLSEQLPEGAAVVTANGTASVAYFQGAVVKEGQRVLWNSGCAAMGYDLPASIGASLAGEGRKVVCLAGDGSIQMNIQELQAIVHYRLPVKIFVLNNNGYHSIRQTQINFFPGNPVGYDADSGVSFPDLELLARAYGIDFLRIDSHDGLDAIISEALAGEAPFICEVMIDSEQPFSPKLSSSRTPDGRIVSKPLEDMTPLLDRDEFRGNMLIEPIQE